MRLILLKSDVQNPGQFKHSGKYALINGRWHKLHHDKPVPKGAAVAAHPHAAGAPVAGKATYTDEQWEQLKLPAENSNASTFNKQIDQLKAAAQAGDVTGILGSGYSTNTYGKKLAIIANHVLGMLGATHTVTPGQKPGAHAAVQTAPQIEAGQPAPVEPPAAATPPSAQATPLSSPAKPKKEFTYSVKPASGGGFYIASDDGGGTVLAHKPTGFGILDNTPAKNFKTEAEALAYMQKKGMKVAGEEPAQPQGKPDVTLTNEGDMGSWKPSLDEVMGLSKLPKEQQIAKLKDWQTKLGGNEKLVQVLEEAQAEAKKKAAAPAAPAAPKPKAEPKPKKQFAVGDTVIGGDISDLPPGSIVSFDNRTALVGHSNVWFNKMKGGGWQKNPLTPSQYSSFMAGGYTKDGAKVVSLGHDNWMHDAQKAGVESILKIKADKGGNPQAYKLGSSVVVGEIGKPHAFVWVGEDGSWGAGFSAKDQQKLSTGEGLDPITVGASPAVDAGPKDGDTKEGSDGTLVFKDGRWHKQVSADLPGAGTATAPAASTGQSQALTMPAFQEGKTVSGVVAYYEKVGQHVLDLAAAGDVDGLQALKADGLKPNGKGKVSNTWAGKTPNSKMLLAMHEQAMLHAGKAAAVQHLEQDQKQSDIPASEKKEDAELVAEIKEKPPAQAVASAVEHLKGDKDQGNLPAAEKKEDAALVQKLEAAQGKPHELELSEYKTGAWAPTLSSKAFKGDNPAWYSQQSGTDIQVHGTMTFEGQGPGEHAKKTLAEYKAAKAAGYSLQNFKTSGLQHAYVFVKDGKILTKEGMAALVAGNQNPIKNETPGAATETAPAAAAESAPIKKEPRLVIPTKTAAAPGASNSKLDQIPWDTQKLPDSNVNAKSHNGKVEQIKAMAYAGDLVGLEAFKAGKNTYGQKQMKLAQLAAAALKEGGAPEEPKPAYMKHIDNLVAQGKWSELEANLQSPFYGSSGKEYIKQKMAEAKHAAAPTATTAKDPLQAVKDSWKKKVESGGANEVKQWLQTYEESNQSGEWNDLIAYGKQLLGGESATAAAPSDNLIMLGIAKLKADQKISQDGKDILEAHLKANPGDLVGAAKQAEAYGYHHTHDAAMQLAAELAGVKQADTGPKEGDTKQGADGMLVLKDGHWVKVDEAKPATVKKLSASEVIQLGKGFKTSAGNKAKIKAFAVAGDMEGLKKFADNLPSNLPASKKLAEKVLAAMEAAPEVPATAAKKKASKPKAAAAPAPAAGAMESIDAWTQTGPQGGSNPGGRFKDPNGEEWYCKFPADEDTAKAEVLAAKLYAALGIAGQDAKLITKDGKVGIASKWTTVSKASSPAALAKVDGVAAGFGADAWLANWDVVGLGYDNLQIGADGKAHRVDAGGSLMYRAQGGKKAFGNIVTEIDSLRDPKINPQAAAVFGGMTEADITASVAKVLALSDFTITTLVNKFGPGSAEDKQALISTLIARKADLAAKFPNASKKKKPVFDPSQISAPPNFLNWGGSGKSGPSSKEFLNQANHRAAQYIFDAAKTGDIEAVKAISAPIYDKNTGTIVGKSPVLEHPSQHIKGYAQQVINEINYQMNPPKKFRFDGGHPLHALNSSYPAYTGSLQSNNVAKVGKYIALGEPGTISADSLGLPKITYQNGQLSKSTYAKAAQAAISKMPDTQKQAVKAYTGSSYGSINGSLWSGNPSGQALSAAQALHTLAHEIAPGTVLSRKISLHGADLDQVLKSTGKVLQEPAIMSTSIRPSCWSGNVHLKLHVGPGVKGLWAGHGSMPGGGALSNHPGEDEIILPPNTRLLILSVKKGGGGDEDGFGVDSSHIVEAVILPSEGY